MTIEGNPAAYVFLRKHGPLIREVKNGGLLLTLEGRVFAIHFLFLKNYLSKSILNEIAEKGDVSQPLSIAMQTGQIIREAAEKWLKDVDDYAKVYPEEIVAPTDLKFREMGALLWVLIASQKKSEQAAGWKGAEL